ncbi:MAG TPA: outer membrane beta-barrel protein [Allosphingosinicella sp.]|jgi:outer membrane immunogenic protein
MRKYIFAALLAGTVAAPAFAQAGGPFTGLRAEAIAGYDSLESGDDADDGVDTAGDEGDESINGIAFGAGVGYDFDLGGAVAGIEGEFTESTGKQDFDETLDAPFSGRIETGRDIYVGGRVGFKVAPTTLVYAKAGYTNTAVEGAFEGQDAGDSFEFDSNVDGYRLGAGVEQVLGSNSYAKIEYRYSNYSNLDFSDDFDLDDLEPEDFDTDIDLDRHQIMAGIGFRF